MDPSPRGIPTARKIQQQKKTDFWTPTPGHPQASSGVFMVYDKRSTPAPVAYQPRHPGNQGNGQEDTTTKKTDFFWGNHKNTTNTTTTTTTAATPTTTTPTTTTTRGHPIASQGIFLVYDKSSTPAPVAYQPRHPGNQGNGQEDTTTKKTDFWTPT